MPVTKLTEEPRGVQMYSGMFSVGADGITTARLDINVQPRNKYWGPTAAPCGRVVTAGLVLDLLWGDTSAGEDDSCPLHQRSLPFSDNMFHIAPDVGLKLLTEAPVPEL